MSKKEPLKGEIAENDIRDWFKSDEDISSSATGFPEISRIFPAAKALLNHPYSQNPYLIPNDSIDLFDVIEVFTPFCDTNRHYLQVLEIQNGVIEDLWKLESPETTLVAVSYAEQGEDSPYYIGLEDYQ